MKDPIYVVNPKTGTTEQVGPTTFYDLKIKERQHLQSWLINRPDALGEPLLLLTSEFDRFDKSDKRLDLLLLDRNCTLVVAELKLDATGTWADQQAIRYGAFCSTMTREDVLDLYSRTSGMSHEEATERICSFLEVEDMPDINGEPRIILAAGSFNDQELTTTVMWLRKFGVDISCVELTPYRYPGDNDNILLVPKILIPLVEARDYQISVERKERTQIARDAANPFSIFHRYILDAYAKLETVIKGPENAGTQDWMSLHIGLGQIHYEWLVRKRAKSVDVALHFESKDQALNLKRLNAVLEKCPGIENAFEFDVENGEWGRKYAHLCVHVPYTGSMPSKEIAAIAAEVMNNLVHLTFETVKNLA